MRKGDFNYYYGSSNLVRIISPILVDKYKQLIAKDNKVGLYL